MSIEKLSPISPDKGHFSHKRRADEDPNRLRISTSPNLQARTKVDLVAHEVLSEVPVPKELEEIPYSLCRAFLKLKETLPEIQYFAIIDQVVLIESYFVDNGFKNRSTTRSAMQIILESDGSFEEKMAELGVIFYYLDRDGQLPCQLHFIEKAAEEIFKEIERLKENHRELDAKHDLPSGVPHYLLQTFASMLISSIQKFNRGSLYALRAFLEKIDLKLLYYFRLEHRDHLLYVLKELEKPQYKSLIEKEIRVHPSLEDLIRIDLHLEWQALVNSSLAMRVCIKALLFDVRQQPHPNCYAITALTCAIENATFKSLSYLIDLLEKGHFTFPQHAKIPLISFLKKRAFQECYLLKRKVNSDSFLGSHLGQNLKRIWSLKKLSLPVENKTVIKHIIQLLLENCFFTETTYAVNVLQSYRQNLLIDLALVDIDFFSCNNNNTKRADLIHSICNTLSKISGQNNQEIKVLIGALKEVLQQHLFLMNHRFSNFAKTNEGFMVSNFDSKIQLKNFNGKLDDLKTKIKTHSFFLFYNHDKEFHYVNKSTKLQEVLLKLVEKAYDKLQNPSLSNAYATLLNLVRQTDIYVNLAEYAANSFKRASISKEFLFKDDLLIFQDEGGSHTTILEKFFNLQFKYLKIKNVNPKQFLKELRRLGNSVKFQTDTRLSLPFDMNTHACILHPQDIRNLLDEKNFEIFYQESFTKPVAQLLQSPIPKAVIDEVMIEIDKHCSETSKKLLKALKFPKEMTHQAFRQMFLKVVTDPAEKTIISNILDCAFERVELDRKAICSIFKMLTTKELDAEKAQAILLSLIEKKECRETPYIWARKLSKLFISLGLGIVKPVILENAIRKYYQLPQVVQTVDTLWQDHKRENPYHDIAVIRHHFGQNNLSYFYRKKDIEYFEDAEEFQKDPWLYY